MDSFTINPCRDDWIDRGTALNALKRYTEAIDCFSKAIDIDPGHKDGWVNKARALEAMGRQTEAAEIYSTIHSE